MTQDKGERVYAVAEKVPDHIGYVTAGKRYEVLHDEPGLAFDFETDVGKVVTATWRNSTHLGGGNWTRIVNTDPPAAEGEGREQAEARIMQEFQWGNLTVLGVANHLRRAGFRQDVAILKANALASPTTETETVAALREALHEIDVEVFNTIPPDGNEAAWGALGRIRDIIAPFRTVRPGAALTEKANG